MPERAGVIAQLSKVLAELYPDRGSAERLARSAGLDITRLAFDPRSLNTWSAIVQEAQFQDRLEKLLELASGEYPKYAALAQAVQAYHALAVAPPAPQSTAAGTQVALAPGQVFLSYSRVDRDYVEGLAAELERRGFPVWYDDRIDLGHRWWRIIERQIETCAAMVVVMSPEARESDWVEREIMLAQQERKPILPLLLRGRGLPLLINQQYADVRGGALPPNTFYGRLRTAIEPSASDSVVDAGSSASESGSPAAPQPQAAAPPGPSPYTGIILTTAQKMTLVKALLNCPVLADRHARDLLVDDLPAALKQSIRRHDRDREDVIAIVTAALNYADGLPSLIELVRFFEAGSLPMGEVDRVLTELELGSLVPAAAAAPAQPARTAPSSTTPTPTTVPAEPRREPAVVAPAATRRPPTSPITFDWVEIPAGEFLMGSDPQKDKNAYPDEKPQHLLTLPRFWMTRVPVTVAQFAAFVNATGRKMSGNIDVKNKANHPVVNVTWHDALAFCRWAGVQLPSEAEWEKAARGTDGRIYPWGDDKPDKSRCNFRWNVGDTTMVGQYPAGASPYGLLDMSGNVWEWTRSLWNGGKKNFGYPYDSNDGREKLGTDARHVLRGGSWVDSGVNVRCGFRARYAPRLRLNSVGFRVVAP